MGGMTGGDGYGNDPFRDAAEAFVDGYRIDGGSIEAPARNGAPHHQDAGDCPERTGELDAEVAEEALNRVADIADRARLRNLDRAVELADFVRAAEHGDLSPEDCVEAADVAHRLAGSAGTFGYLAATELARRIEQTFLDGHPRDVQDDVQEHVRELIQRLHEPPDVDDL
jgi:HPt (histidine-containing phosphotransfer) domain-containing protein